MLDHVQAAKQSSRRKRPSAPASCDGKTNPSPVHTNPEMAGVGLT